MNAQPGGVPNQKIDQSTPNQTAKGCVFNRQVTIFPVRECLHPAYAPGEDRNARVYHLSPTQVRQLTPRETQAFLSDMEQMAKQQQGAR